MPTNFLLCPNCNFEITYDSVSKNADSAKAIDNIVHIHEQKYKQELREELEKVLRPEIEIQLTNKKAEIEKNLNDIILTLKEKIIEKDSIIQNNEEIISAKITEERMNLNNEFNKKLLDQNKKIADLELVLSNKENEISNFNKEIDLKVSESIAKKEKEITSLKEEMQKEKLKLIQENNQLFEAEKQKYNNLQIEINNKNNVIENFRKELDLKIMEKVTEKEKEVSLLVADLNQEKFNIITNYEKQIKQLELANEKQRLIQNKAKGENFELEVETELRKVFDMDIISKITTGAQKADFLQIIKDNGIEVGRIVYEVKNAAWSETWEKKLVQDISSQNSKYGILVASTFQDKYRGIPFKVSDYSPNIFLSSPEAFTFVSQIIKKLIITEYKISSSSKSDEEKNNLIEKINRWRDLEFPVVSKLFQDQFKQIEDSENSVKKNMDKIRISREKLSGNWEKVVKTFIENIV